MSNVGLNDLSHPISPDTLKRLDKLSDAAAAEIAAARAIWIDTQDRLSFAEKGLIAEYVERRELWRSAGVDSMNRWIEHYCPFSRSSWFDALRRWKELADIPVADRIQMTRANLIMMKKIPESIRKDAVVIEAAKECRDSNDFIEVVGRKYPDLHLEPSVPVIMAETSAAKVVEEAVQLAMKLGAHNRSEALEDIAQNYIEDHRDEYDSMFMESTPQRSVSA